MIWNKCPKNIFVGRKTLEIGVFSAILQFNDRIFGVAEVLKYFGIHGGVSFTSLSLRLNQISVRHLDIKSSEKGLKRRKVIRTVKKGIVDKEVLNEPQEAYIAGGY